MKFIEIKVNNNFVALNGNLNDRVKHNFLTADNN